MDSGIYIIFGKSGCGKSFITRNAVQKSNNLVYVPSHTTRKMRPGEDIRSDYKFVTNEEFKENIDDCIEYSLVYDNYYGLMKNDLFSKLRENTNVIIIMDQNGVKSMKKLFGSHVRSIFIDSDDDRISKQLNNRPGNDQDHKRISNDLGYTVTCEVDHTVFNDGTMLPVDEVVKICSERFSCREW